MILSSLILTLAGCNVASDSTNEQVTLSYNQQRIEDAAVKTGQAAKNLASGAGNVISATGRAIKNEVGDIDVDVDVRRNAPGNNQNNQ